MKGRIVINRNDVYKPRGQTRRKGVAQMTQKCPHRGGGGQNCPKFCPRGLYTPPMTDDPFINTFVVVSKRKTILLLFLNLTYPKNPFLLRVLWSPI